MRRRASFLTVAALVTGFANRPARADATTHDCVAAAHDGQEQRDSGRLSAARETLVRCRVDACPAVVRESCERWATDVETRVPTIALGARDQAGADLADVRVSIDGVVVARKLDGRSIAVDPGPHEVAFDAEGFTTAHLSLILREGEKTRPVVALLTRPLATSVADTPEPQTESPRSLTPVILSGAVGAVGLTGFAVFGLWGKSERDRLFESCAPTKTCPAADVSSARTKWIVADVSLVVGVVGVGVMAAYLIAPLFHRDRSTAHSARATSAGVAPTKNGVLGTLQWSY